MNYRHAYHAGNFADVFKHVTLVALLQSFFHKETPICYFDTHAGAGNYDLSSNAAQKNKEFELGIGKIFSEKNPPELIKQYLSAIKNPKTYPGSPLIAKHFLRPEDRMVLTELHPEEYQYLKKLFANQAQVEVHHQNGYQALKAFLPPKEKRGLVLIDPPYEKNDEYPELTKGLSEALKRWETGVYAIWYPIKKANQPHPLRELKTNRPILTAELAIYPLDVPLELNACGMTIINPPWKLAETLETVVPWLYERLKCDNKAPRPLIKTSA